MTGEEMRRERRREREGGRKGRVSRERERGGYWVHRVLKKPRIERGRDEGRG